MRSLRERITRTEPTERVSEAWRTLAGSPTCLRYYNEVTDTEPCPCGCFVPKGRSDA